MPRRVAEFYNIFSERNSTKKQIIFLVLFSRQFLYEKRMAVWWCGVGFHLLHNAVSLFLDRCCIVSP